MANFRTHVSFGAIVAMVGVVLAYYYAYVTDWRLLVAMFLISIVASFMPDLDSDNGLPFSILFGTLTLFVTGFTFYITLLLDFENILVRFGVPLVVGLVFWTVFGGIFKKLTHHRGMFHSVPAVFIASLLTYILFKGVLSSEYSSVLLALAVGVGYLSHLILDEVYSSVSINGNPFRPKRSLGSALKLLSSSNIANIFTYTIFVLLLFVAFT